MRRIPSFARLKDGVKIVIYVDLGKRVQSMVVDGGADQQELRQEFYHFILPFQEIIVPLLCHVR